MDDLERAVYEARYKTILQANSLIVEIESRHGSVMPHFITVMESYRIPLLQMIAVKDLLSPLAERTLNALNDAIVYAKTKDPKVRKRYIKEFKAGDRIVAKLKKEGVFR